METFEESPEETAEHYTALGRFQTIMDGYGVDGEQ
jgi:hypothetical protein